MLEALQDSSLTCLSTAEARIPQALSRTLESRLERLPCEVTDHDCNGAWNGERLFWSYRWLQGGGETIALLRIQYFPLDNSIWIGSIEVNRDYQNRGIGRHIVTQLERAGVSLGVEIIRLFARRSAAQFWKQLNYTTESDPRIWRKSLASHLNQKVNPKKKEIDKKEIERDE